ncbi:MAG: RidA family protein [Clostridiales bacterium]|jgi:enamine deaminase RidA (YjgF/YER057c/UK114 family)|nr:RidA family protein [Clostridiales bacterium]
MGAIETKLNEVGYILPEPPAKGGVYTPCKIFSGGRLAYVSGCGPSIGGVNITGKAGKDVPFEDVKTAVRNAMLNVLAVLNKTVGGLDNIKSCVKITVFINSADDFTDQPAAANAATELLVAIFGEERGCPSRSAIGVNVLPGDITAEIEMLVELE